MRSPIQRLSTSFVASDQKVGGSLMRIHKDVRFAKDKTPYKTNLGIQFRHAAGKDVHAPGIYFHVDGDEVFLGVGTWRPEPEPLATIRKAIAEAPDAWAKVRDDARFRAYWSLGGESLSRPPRGFDKDHVHADDLRRKDHIAVCNLQHADVLRADLPELLAERLADAKAYLAWLCRAIGVAF